MKQEEETVQAVGRKEINNIKVQRVYVIFAEPRSYQTKLMTVN